MGEWCVCAPVHTYGGQSKILSVFIYCFSFFPLRLDLSLNPKLTKFGQAGVPGSACLSPPMLTSQELEVMPSF